MSADTASTAVPEAQLKGWRGHPSGKPSQTGATVPERHRLKMTIGHRKRSLRKLDEYYAERRALLLKELAEAQARVAEIDAEREQSTSDSAAWS